MNFALPSGIGKSSLIRRIRRTILARRAGFSLIELLIVLVIIGILAALAVPRYTSYTTKAKQTEAKELLHQIYLVERVYFNDHDQYWIPPAGTVADRDHPFAFDIIGVEIMKSARYTYSIVGDRDHFLATATATRLDDDPAIDQWQIDETGELLVVFDDSVLR